MKVIWNEGAAEACLQFIFFAPEPRPRESVVGMAQ